MESIVSTISWIYFSTDWDQFIFLTNIYLVLIYARLCSRCWWYSIKQDRQNKYVKREIFGVLNVPKQKPKKKKWQQWCRGKCLQFSSGLQHSSLHCHHAQFQATKSGHVFAKLPDDLTTGLGTQWPQYTTVQPWLRSTPGEFMEGLGRCHLRGQPRASQAVTVREVPSGRRTGWGPLVEEACCSEEPLNASSWESLWSLRWDSKADRRHFNTSAVW